MAEKKYKAFISYKREDVSSARWLQDKLMYYRLPTKLCEQYPSSPSKLGNICRDITNLGGRGELEEKIQRLLEDSEFLVVVCSKKSAKSEWVGKEVKYFHSLGGSKDHIILFSIDGVPYSNDPMTECVHPIVKECIEGVPQVNDINEKGVDSKRDRKNRAFISVVSHILNIEFRQLWRPYEKALKRKRLIRYILAIIIFVALCLTMDYYVFPKHEYYADYVDKWGMPTGVVELTKEQVKHKEGHYRFKYTHRFSFLRGGLLKEVVYANSYGTAIEHAGLENTDRSSIMKIEQRKDGKEGKVIDIEYQNNVQKPLIRASIAGDSMQYVDLKSFTNATQDAALDASITQIRTSLFNNNPQESKSEIRRYRLSRNDNGFIKRKLFKKYNSNDDIQICDAQGVYGFDYELDSLGRPIQVKYLGFEKTNIQNKVGVASKKYSYDKHGNIVECRYLDINDNLVLNELLWARYTLIIDGNGNPKRGCFYDINGEQCYNENGIAGVLFVRNSDGLIVEAHYLDIDNKLTLMDGVAIQKISYDSNGRPIQLTNLDLHGLLCPNLNGIAVEKYECDNNGCIIKAAYYDDAENPYLNKYGYFCQVQTYDLNLNTTEVSFYGIENKPCFIEGGYSSVKREYDNDNNVTKTSFHDIYGDATMIYPERYSSFSYSYNKGNVEKVSCYDVFGKPTLNNNGYSILKNTYNDYGNIVEQAYFDINGDPCICQDSYSSIKYKYDNSGNMTSSALYDKDGLPYAIGSTHMTLIEYDDRGRKIKSLNYNTSGELCSDAHGVSIRLFKYDQNNNIIEYAYLDNEEKPCVASNGGAYVQSEYDNRGNLVMLRILDAEHKPCLSEASGICTIRNEYDDRNHLVKKTYYNVNDELCCNNDGCAIHNIEYDIYGHIIMEVYLMPDKKPAVNTQKMASCIKYDNNQFGYPVKISHYGIDGELCKNNDQYAIEEIEYEPKGGICARAFYDENRQPCNNKDGWHKYICGMDNYSGLNIDVYYNANNQPIEINYQDYFSTRISNNNGVATMRYEYDKNGNEIKQLSYDVNDNLCVDKEFGCAVILSQYNQEGQLILQEFLDEKEEECANIFGIYKICSVYDSNGTLLENNFRDQYWNLCESKNGVAGTVYRYNKDNKLELSGYFDKEQNECINKESKFSAVTYLYDDQQNIRCVTFLDEESNFCMNNKGYAYVTYTYDYRFSNDPYEAFYFDPDDKLVDNIDGVAYVINNYEKNEMYFFNKNLDMVKKPQEIDLDYFEIELIM